MYFNVHRVKLLRAFCFYLLFSLWIIGSIGSVVYAKTFIDPFTITIDGVFTDWGTSIAPSNGVHVFQDMSNSGEHDGTGFIGKAGDINYFWVALSTQQGGDAVASPSNLIEYVYIRIDVGDDEIKGQSYFLQLNLGTANATYADHLLQIWVDSKDISPVTIVLYEYEMPYPQIGSFTTGLINGLVTNVLSPYPGFTGVQDTNASGAIGVYDGTNFTIESKIPIEWYSSKYGGSFTANGTGENALISTIFSDTGTLGSVGAVKDTINNADGITQSFSINKLSGEVITENLVIPWFTSLPLVVSIIVLLLTVQRKNIRIFSY